MAEEQTQSENGGGVATAKDTLSVTDNRTGEQYEVEIENGTIKTMDLRQIKVNEDDFGLMGYDPAFTNTASTKSEITYIDGEAGILEHRGYSIEQLCEKSTYLEVAYLLVHGELPTKDQLDKWEHDVTIHTFVHENIKEFLDGLPPRRAPDGDAALDGRRALDLLPRGQGHPGRERALLGHDPARSRRCRRSPPSPTATRSGCPTTIRTTT